MDPRLLEKHLSNAISLLAGVIGGRMDDSEASLLLAVEDIQAARRELWQNKPELEGAKP